jgi:hypothetical protein
LSVRDYNPLLRNRRQRLDELRTALGTTLPAYARAKIIRTINCLELLQPQVAELYQEREPSSTRVRRTQVGPDTFDLDALLIHPPGTGARAQGCRGVGLDPTEQRRVIHPDAMDRQIAQRSR